MVKWSDRNQLPMKCVITQKVEVVVEEEEDDEKKYVYT